MSSYLWMVPFFPGLAAAFNGMVGQRYCREWTGHIATASMLISLVFSSIALTTVISAGESFQPLDVDYLTWLTVGEVVIPFGIYIDQLTVIMMMVISLVGSVIFIYATGYMKGDVGYGRFFTFFPLFTFFMFILVMANSLPVLFIGWEGVGLCSYLLIGYFYDRDYAAKAGMKAFLVNRIGDFAFMIGMFMLFYYVGSLKFSDINETAPVVFAYAGIPVTIVALLLFFGATGKSAQIPLFTWLPDAMAGPTPVSALIHAATMVTAGIYLIVRLNPLFSQAPAALLVIGVIGGLTAIFAASIALVQRDSKKILAYSTVSQLGYMFLAIGSGAYIAAIFHLMTHAFFKACLFLGAGSVLHAFHRDTDVDVMEAGNLRKYLPWTHLTFLIATIAIAGIPPLAGFWSKDEILWEAFYTGNVFLWILGLIAAFCTAFYMFRLYFLLFDGEFRGTEEQRKNLHESPASMWVPLVVLAFFSIIVGWLNMPLLGYTGFHDFLHPVIQHAHHAESFIEGNPLDKWTWELILAIISVSIAIAGILYARLIYVWFPSMAGRMKDTFLEAHEILEAKYRIDEAYDNAFVHTYMKLCEAAAWFDEHVIIGGINRTVAAVRSTSDVMRRVQTGYTPHYALATLAGMVFLVVVLFLCY